MSTLKTNNIEHLDASSPSIQIGVGGGVNISGVTTVGNNLTIDGNNRNITTGVGQTVGFGTDISINGNLIKDGNSFIFPSSGGTFDRLERAGNVLQVVQNTYSTATVISNTSYTNTGLTATITPTSSSSKILVFVTQLLSYTSTNIYKYGGYRLVRDITGEVAVYEPSPVSGGRYYLPGLYLGGSGTNDFNYGFIANLTYLDSPATTSTIVYKTQVDSFDASGSITAQIDDKPSVMILMEVAA